jgi:predicted transcriptional regulator of viral defense system
MPGKYWNRVMDVAVENGGYVTPSLVDVPAVELRKMVARGTLDSVCRGVYRVPSLPFDRNDEFILARFWAAGRGTISHESALLVHDLCDINPTAVHLTIPTSYRISRAGGELYEIHWADLTDTEVMRIDAVVLTTIPRTLADSIGHAPEYLVHQAIDTAARRGAITQAERSRLAATADAST